MGSIPEEKIAEVRDRVDIVQVVGEHVALRRAGGGNFKGLCPFHDEKTPSFNVNATRQFFHCFGCQASGDVIRFMMEFEKRDFMDVLRDLAGRAGIELPTIERSSAEMRAVAERKTERERLLSVNRLADDFYRSELRGPAGQKARAYLAGRAIDEAMIERFHIGYAPDGWDRLQTMLAQAKVPLELADRLGLCGTTERGRRYDFFRDRIMLPVFDRSGQIVAFGSRLLDPEAKERKYVNSPDSPIYHKKDNLYGLFAALPAMRKGGRVILVEGNFDVISLHQAGFEETVAPMGTALGADQIALLSRLAEEVILLFDGDGAGRKATRSATELLSQTSLRARVVALPDGQDPDDFVRTQGAQALRSRIEKAPPAVEHFLDELALGAEASVPGRLAALASAKPMLLGIADPVSRDLYIRRLAGKLSMDPHVAERALRSAALSPLTKNNKTDELSKPSSPTLPPPRKTAPEEVKLIALLLAEPQLAGQASQSHAEMFFSDSDLAQLYRMIADQILTAGRGSAEALLEAAPADLRGVLGHALVAEEVASPRAFADCLRKMQDRRLSDEMAEVKRQYEKDRTPELLTKLTEVARQRQALRANKGDS